jgi:hypothetical protein
MSLIRSLSAFAFAGAVGIAGTASARPDGQPPQGTMRSDFSVRFAQDGRAETGGAEGRNAIPRGFIEKSNRPDNNVGQERHFALPIKSDINMRVNLGDGGEASHSASMKSKTESQGTEVKGFYKKPQLPIPMKTEIVLQVSAGGEASVDGGDRERNDDPKSARVNTNSSQHMNPKVYPGRHEHPPAVYEMFMSVHKTESASSDAAGDKDAG